MGRLLLIVQLTNLLATYTDPKGNVIWSGSLEDLPPKNSEGCEIQVISNIQKPDYEMHFLDAESGKTQEADISLNAANSDNSVNESNPEDLNRVVWEVLFNNTLIQTVRG